jgi:hypothetical protein
MQYGTHTAPHVNRPDSVEPGPLAGHIDRLFDPRILHLPQIENNDQLIRYTGINLELNKVLSKNNKNKNMTMECLIRLI